MENSAALMIRENAMKYGWCKTFNNTVHYHQTPFEIALILEQVSKHNAMLIEQIRTDKDIRMQQHDEIGERIQIKLKIKRTHARRV